MRIISDFRDYYDCIAATDKERTPVYIRNVNNEHFEKCPFPSISYDYGSSWRSWHCDEKIIGFCGKIYPFLTLSDYNGHTAKCRTIEQAEAFFNLLGTTGSSGKEAMLAWLELDRIGLKRRKYRRHFTYINPDTRSGFKEYFDDVNDSSKWVSWFEKKHCPIFVGRSEGHKNYCVEWNANLRAVEFYKVFPPEQAYQSIRMFLDNLAVPLPNVPPVSDKQMAEIKGFNKYSFRKDPIRKRR